MATCTMTLQQARATNAHIDKQLNPYGLSLIRDWTINEILKSQII